jgi:hypothetical protein
MSFQVYRLRPRVSRRVVSWSMGLSTQTQGQPWCSHSSHRFASKAWTRMAVVGLGLPPIEIQSPTWSCCSSGMSCSALGRPRLSSRS